VVVLPIQQLERFREMKKFYDTYGVPSLYIQQFERCVGSLEHPIYHPEKYLDKHIEIVVNRAMTTDIKELHFAGALHDITKCGVCPELWEGVKGENTKGYHSNKLHDEQSVDFINLPQITTWLIKNDVNIDMVKDICLNHMKIKEHLYGRWANGIVLSKEFQKSFKHGDIRLNTLKSLRLEPNYWDLAYYFSSFCDNMMI